jgi:hypothetical protein
MIQACGFVHWKSFTVPCTTTSPGHQTPRRNGALLPSSHARQRLRRRCRMP